MRHDRYDALPQDVSRGANDIRLNNQQLISDFQEILAARVQPWTQIDALQLFPRPKRASSKKRS
jgi:hypothetical protein